MLRHRPILPMPDLRPLWQRALAWSLAGVLAGVFGTLGWVVSLALLLGGLLVSQAAGLGLPAWACALAFVIGMPLGAWMEIRFVGR